MSKSFEILKNYLITKHVLKLFHYKLIVVFFDASQVAGGTILKHLDK